MLDLSKFKVVSDHTFSVIGKPDQVLCELDGLMLFTIRVDEQLLLLYLLEELEAPSLGLRYLVVETSSVLIDLLTKGEVSLYESLDMDPVWIIDTRPEEVNGEWCDIVVECREGAFGEIPGDRLPEPGVLLYFEHEIKRKK